MTTNPEMNAEIVGILRTAASPHCLYAAERIEELEAELSRLETWDGLMRLLDRYWPADVFPTRSDESQRDPGPRIVSLIRQLDGLRKLCSDAEHWLSVPATTKSDRELVQDLCRRLRQAAPRIPDP